MYDTLYRLATVGDYPVQDQGAVKAEFCESKVSACKGKRWGKSDEAGDIGHRRTSTAKVRSVRWGPLLIKTFVVCGGPTKHSYWDMEEFPS